MKELLFYLSSLIINEKDKLQIKEIDSDFFKKYLIKVSKNDIQNIIGKDGKTIKAIRNIISMATIIKGIKKKIPIEIVGE